MSLSDIILSDRLRNLTAQNMALRIGGAKSAICTFGTRTFSAKKCEGIGEGISLYQFSKTADFWGS